MTSFLLPDSHHFPAILMHKYVQGTIFCMEWIGKNQFVHREGKMCPWKVQWLVKWKGIRNTKNFSMMHVQYHFFVLSWFLVCVGVGVQKMHGKTFFISMEIFPWRDATYFPFPPTHQHTDTRFKWKWKFVLSPLKIIHKKFSLSIIFRCWSSSNTYQHHLWEA